MKRINNTMSYYKQWFLLVKLSWRALLNMDSVDRFAHFYVLIYQQMGFDIRHFYGVDLSFRGKIYFKNSIASCFPESIFGLIFLSHFIPPKKFVLNSLTDALLQSIFIDKECPICFEVGDEQRPSCIVTTCGHMFHTDCAQRWLKLCEFKKKKEICPCCRSRSR